MERSSKISNRNALFGTAPLGSVPAAPAASPPAPQAEATAVDRATVSRRPLERLLEPGAPSLRQTAAAQQQTPSLQDAASNNDWLEWATTFG